MTESERQRQGRQAGLPGEGSSGADTSHGLPGGVRPGGVRPGGVGPIDWTVLLAHWTSMAQASVGLPKTGEGERWRSSVPAIVGLQALACAVGDLDRLTDRQERPLAIDRAEVLLRKHAGELRAAWHGEPMPEGLQELVHDARLAVEHARLAGVEWLFPETRKGRGGAGGVGVGARVGEVGGWGGGGVGVVVPHPAGLVDLLVAGLGFAGDVYLPSPGVLVSAPAPVGFARLSPGAGGGVPDVEVTEAIGEFLASAAVAEQGRSEAAAMVPVASAAPWFRQVYRQFDFAKGGPVRDLVVPEDHTLPAGQPLLVPVLLGGEPQPVSLPPRSGHGVAGLGVGGPLPVEFV